MTGGLDSRGVLGVLLDLGRPPDKIRHVKFVPGEYEAAARIAHAYSIPLDTPAFENLNFPKLTRRWVERTAGFLHYHQFYLLDMFDRTPPGGVVGFDGHLMDWFLGVHMKARRRPVHDPIDATFNRVYLPGGPLHLLFPDARDRTADARERLAEQLRTIEGSLPFRMMMLDVVNRGLKYTGAAYPPLQDEMLCFAPGGHTRALDFITQVPWSVAVNKQARLRSLRVHHPELAEFPGAKGESYLELSVIQKRHAPISTYFRPLLSRWLSGGRLEHAPDTVHA